MSHTFSANFVYRYIVCLQKGEETNNFQHKYIFYDQDQIC